VQARRQHGLTNQRRRPHTSTAARAWNSSRSILETFHHATISHLARSTRNTVTFCPSPRRSVPPAWDHALHMRAVHIAISSPSPQCDTALPKLPTQPCFRLQRIRDPGLECRDLAELRPCRSSYLLSITSTTSTWCSRHDRSSMVSRSCSERTPSATSSSSGNQHK
jgi:hypothetical protein